MKEKLKIVIVDDHQLFAQSLSYLIGTFGNYAVVGHFVNGKDFINALDNDMEKPDLVLLDVNMPIMNGVETMKYLNVNYFDVKVLALSVNNEEETVLKMLTNGAKGYILKDTSPNLFKQALDEVYEKGFYYSEMVSNFLIHSLNKSNETIVLKDKELEFIKLACTEKTYKEIADEMCLSPKTIDGYRENIFQKLDVKTRIGLVIYAIKHKLIEVN
ncbi:response regulator transcription factor [Chryseobacterium sp. POL2]|uniref:response regulator n=1 Tax=Chryseobacterium sp. POL2 TaxID=2713414 RepID=UPI0013E0FE06|nr:response regulator transcription factor [Chryseobacterium sp. POL2]QIG89834.1 response regulator transcription factor [Chryseobacterium sp. POL2]